METALGKSILNQIAFGRLRFIRRMDLKLGEFSRLSRDEEEQRFRLAQRRAVLQLTDFYNRACQQVGEGTASIFAIHAILLEDNDFESSILAIIRELGATAEYAVNVVGGSFASAFAAMDSPYMRARAVDIRDISWRVIRLLLGLRPLEPLRESPAILVADEFFPSEVMELNQRNLLGLIARKGSVDSHTSLLLRAYGIPAMAEVELDPEWDGHLSLLDGFDHRLYLDPDPETLEQLRLRYQAGGKPAVT